MAGRKKSRTRRLMGRLAASVSATAQKAALSLKRAARTSIARIRPWGPCVAVDVRGKRGRALRGAIARATRTHLRALGVAAPGHLLIVVQRTVVEDDRPLAALLQVFEDGAGQRRQVLFLALSVEGRQVSDEEVIATLRQQLQRVAADELGELRLSVPLEPVRSRRPARVVSLRRTADHPPFEDEDVPPPDDYEGYDDGRMAVAADG